MKNLIWSLPLFLVACGSETQVENQESNDTTTVVTDVIQPDDYSGTYQYINPYNDLDIIHNHYIVLEKNSDDTYSGRYYGPTDIIDLERVEYSAGFFVLPMSDLVIEGETMSFDLVPNQTDFFNETVTLDMKSSAAAAAAGLTQWEVYALWEKRSFTAQFMGGTISLNDQAEEMVFIPMD